jgi:hypothetical protein
MSHKPNERSDRRFDDELKPFDDELKKWAERPASTPPVWAARRVLARIDEEDARRHRWRFQMRPAALWLASAAAVLALVVGTFLLRNESSPVPLAVQAELETPPLGNGVALIWIDSETPLYMTFQPPVTDLGNTP